MFKQTVLKSLSAAAAVAGLGACTAIPVRTDVNPNLAATTCHTYAFADQHVANTDQPSAFGNPLNAERLRQAIESNMAAKGVQKVDDRMAAECVVGYAMGTRQVFDNYYGGFGLGYGWGGPWGRPWGWGGGLGYEGPAMRDETRISVDLFDAKSRAPIWHASVSQSVGDLQGAHALERINAATAAIFAKFPGSAPQAVTGGRAST